MRRRSDRDPVQDAWRASEAGMPGAAQRASGTTALDGPGRDPLSAGRAVRILRALSGSVAAGLVILTIGIVIVSFLGGTRGIPGPGTESLTVHLVSAAVVLGLQRFADRGRGFVAGLCSCAVLAVAFAVLWTQWWG